MNGKKKFYLLLSLFQIILVLTVFFSVDGLISFASAQTEPIEYFNSPTTIALALSAALSVGCSVLGSAWAIKTVGTAAISALTEREEAFGKLLTLVVLAEALAIYGLIVAILLWTKIPSPPV